VVPAPIPDPKVSTTMSAGCGACRLSASHGNERLDDSLGRPALAPGDQNGCHGDCQNQEQTTSNENPPPEHSLSLADHT
jgi:hypothetical protein